MPLTRKSSLLGAACAGLVLAVLGSTTAGAAETKEGCVKANGDAQALRIGGKLRAARSLLVECGDPGCPALVRDDCAERLDELERAQPTMVLDVKDASGADVSGVTLTIDGEPLPETLQGRALPVDPGEHELVLTAEGFSPAKRRFILKEGEKGRRERIVLERPAVEPTPAHSGTAPPGADLSVADATPAAMVKAPPSTEAPASAGTHRTLGLIAGGVGLVGIAIGSGFGILTFSAAAAQNNACGAGAGCEGRSLALSDHSRAMTDGAISTGSFVAGGALVAVGAALLLTSWSGKANPSTRLLVTPRVGHGEAGLFLGTEFF
jgi:hypothetical protein